MSKREKRLTRLSAALFGLVAPLIVFLSFRFLSGSRSFYVPALAMVVLSFLPFFFWFEARRVKSGELVVIAAAVAAAVAGRAVMGFIPQLKPVGAVVVMTAAAFG